MLNRVHPLTLALAAFLAIPLAATDLLAESRRDRVRELEQINRRWQGAECRLKTRWQFKRKRNDGWFKSRMQVTASDRFERITLRLRLREREPLSRRFAGDDLMAGTRFECLGFRFREKDLDNLYLAMRSRDGRVETELVVWTGKNWASKPDLKQVPDVERFLRLHWIDVRSVSERLDTVASLSSNTVTRPVNPFAPRAAATPVAPNPRSPAPAPAPPATDPRGGSGGEVFRPEIEVLAVSVQPTSVRAGRSVQLVVHYSVSGLPAGAQFEVSERRALQAGERELTASTQKIARSNGTYTSRLEAPIPAGAATGLYRFVAGVGMTGVEPQEGSALFEVVP